MLVTNNDAAILVLLHAATLYPFGWDPTGIVVVVVVAAAVVVG